MTYESWPPVYEIHGNRITLMQAGARIFIDWFEDLSFHGLISLVDEPQSLTLLSQRLTDHKLSSISSVISGIAEDIELGKYTFPKMQTEILDSAIICRGILKLDQLDHDVQWATITAAGVSINKNQIAKYAKEYRSDFRVLHVEKDTSAEVPYQKIWFISEVGFAFVLEYSYNAQFAKEYKEQETYNIRYSRYPDHSVYRIYPFETRKSNKRFMPKEIPSLEKAQRIYEEIVRKNPFVPQVPMLFHFESFRESEFRSGSASITTTNSIPQKFSEILFLTSGGIIFGEYNKETFRPLTLISENQLIPMSDHH